MTDFFSQFFWNKICYRPLYVTKVHSCGDKRLNFSNLTVQRSLWCMTWLTGCKPSKMFKHTILLIVSLKKDNHQQTNMQMKAKSISTINWLAFMSDQYKSIKLIPTWVWSRWMQKQDWNLEWFSSILVLILPTGMNNW